MSGHDLQALIMNLNKIGNSLPIYKSFGRKCFNSFIID